MTDGREHEISDLKARLAALEGQGGSAAKTKPKGKIGLGGGCLVAFVGLIAFSAIVSAITQSSAPPTRPPSAPDPTEQAKGAAAIEARLAVPSYMKDPSSAQFGRVWGMAPHIACGFVNGKNGFGALAGEQRFIYTMGAVAFGDGSSKFARSWNTLCVDKLLSKAPSGVTGHNWGSRPSSNLKQYMAPTDEGLSVYIPKVPLRPFEGVPVKEADYDFDHGRLYAADVYFSGEANREAIKVALQKDYGSPLEADDGAHSYAWKWPDRNVTIDLTWQESSSTATVTFAHGKH
jgi:hypothetical protein